MSATRTTKVSNPMQAIEKMMRIEAIKQQKLQEKETKKQQKLQEKDSKKQQKLQEKETKKQMNKRARMHMVTLTRKWKGVAQAYGVNKT